MVNGKKEKHTFWVTFWALRPRAYCRRKKEISLLLHNVESLTGSCSCLGEQQSDSRRLETYSDGGHCDLGGVSFFLGKKKSEGEDGRKEVSILRLERKG